VRENPLVRSSELFKEEISFLFELMDRCVFPFRQKRAQCPGCQREAAPVEKVPRDGAISPPLLMAQGMSIG
jgi:hypothetical protein